MTLITTDQSENRAIIVINSDHSEPVEMSHSREERKRRKERLDDRQTRE